MQIILQNKDGCNNHQKIRIKIQRSKLGKARAKNCDAAYV